jgi:signal transduction histidine kinase
MRKTLPIERIEAQAFRRQQIAFSLLTLFVLAVLLALHTLFASLLGEPTRAVISFLGLAFSLKVLEVIWLQGRQDGITEDEAKLESSISIVGLFVLTGLLAFFTNRDDAPYFVLLAIAILQCAYHFGLLPTVISIVASIGMMFAWILHYFAIHPPPRPTEYLQSGMISVIYSLMGPLVWYLVNQLKEKQNRLYEKRAELESAQERLVAEEKLAAVGRLASGIAHEIRNPVAMIASSLATAAYPAADSAEREEMFLIAAREAKRLENLTAEFLTYARPSKPQRSAILFGDVLRHIADVTKMRAASRSIEVACEMSCDVAVEVDALQVEGALLNLSLNAIDATPDGGRIKLRTRLEGSALRIDVENSGMKIPDAYLERVFEPFFTTKSSGTGLGLAIARAVAIAHGGDVWISANRDGSVVFTMTLASDSTGGASEEAAHGKCSGC